MSRRPPPRSELPALIVLVALVVLGSVGAMAAPPPQSVCGPCNDGLVRAAEQHNLPLEITASTVEVQLHENGSATWTVTSRFAADEDPDPNAYPPNATLRSPDEIGTNATLRGAILRAAVDDSRDYLEPDRPDATIRSARLDNATLHFTFHEPDVARETPGGVLLVDEYHTRGLGSGWYVDVDRMTLVGPRNTTIANDVQSAIGADVVTVDGNRLVLEGDPADPPAFDRDDVYVAFAQPGPVSGLLAQVGILLATLPTVVGSFASVHLPGLVVLLVALVVTHLVRKRQYRTAMDETRALLTWTALALLLYLLPTVTFISPLTPHPMVSRLLATMLVGYALLVAAGSWILYPRARNWV
jgi:hypothetical protein